MAIDINEIAINEAIRYHKPNDPYYWEVDNLPLIDIMRNIVLTADKINELVLEINNHYDKGEITALLAALTTRKLSDVDDVAPALNNVLKWNGTTYTPGPGSSWTYELGDVYDDQLNNRVHGDILVWDDNGGGANVQRYEQKPLTTNLLNDVDSSSPAVDDTLIYEAGTVNKFVAKPNELINLKGVSDNTANNSFGMMKYYKNSSGVRTYSHEEGTGTMTASTTYMLNEFVTTNASYANVIVEVPFDNASNSSVNSGAPPYSAGFNKDNLISAFGTNPAWTSTIADINAYLSHYIVFARMKSSGTTNKYLRAHTGARQNYQPILFTANTSYVCAQAIIPVDSNSTSNDSFLYVHGTTGGSADAWVVGYVLTRAFEAIARV